jgi:hypothetical protein
MTNTRQSFGIQTLLLAVICIDTLLTPISLILGHLGFSAGFHFFKLPFVTIYVLLIFRAVKYGLVNNATIHFLVAIFFLACIVGLSRGQLNSAFLSHLYHISLAISGCSLGCLMDLDRLKVAISKYHSSIVLFALVFAVIYFICYRIGLISYWGVSSNFGLIAVMIATSGRSKLLVTLVFAIVLTGKRTVLLGTISVILVYYLLRDLKLMTIVKVGIVFAVFGYLSFSFGLLSRFIQPFAIEDSTRFWYVITSGRNFEVVYALQEFETWVDWLVGFGYGMRFELPMGMDNLSDSYQLHYTHFSPMSIMLLYGAVTTLILYILFFKFAWLALKNMRSNYSVFCVLYLYAFLTSFAGATLFVDPKFWLLLGIMIRVGQLEMPKIQKRHGYA